MIRDQTAKLRDMMSEQHNLQVRYFGLRVRRLVGVALLLLALSLSQLEAAKPNVVFIVCDDLNTHVSTSGYEHIQTPNFDKLAAAGMNFKRAYCQYPVCGPSRASFLSGLYPESTKVLNNKLDIRKTNREAMSIPQAFKEAGYWTAGTGKIFHNKKADHGDTAWSEPAQWFDNDPMPLELAAIKKFEEEVGPVKGNRKKLKEFMWHYAPQLRNQKTGYGPSGLTDNQHKDGKNATQVEKWLDEKAYGEKPFFIAVGIHKPHVPFLAPDKYFDLYPQEGLVLDPVSKEFWDQAPKSAGTKRYKTFGFEEYVENDALRREYVQAYHACTTFIDAQIGRVLDAIERNGHWENTIIVLTSDHGYLLGDKFMWGKVMLFELGTKVPLLVRVPKDSPVGATTPGSSTEALVELVDLFPTFAQLCDLPAPSDLQGVSLVPLLKDPSAQGKEYAYTVVSSGKKGLGRAIRTKDWRYSQWPDGEELYDLKNDPKENINLAKSKDDQAQLEKMRLLIKKAEAKATTSNN